MSVWRSTSWWAPRSWSMRRTPAPWVRQPEQDISPWSSASTSSRNRRCWHQRRHGRLLYFVMGSYKIMLHLSCLCCSGIFFVSHWLHSYHMFGMIDTVWMSTYHLDSTLNIATETFCPLKWFVLRILQITGLRLGDTSWMRHRMIHWEQFWHRPYSPCSLTLCLDRSRHVTVHAILKRLSWFCLALEFQSICKGAVFCISIYIRWRLCL